MHYYRSSANGTWDSSSSSESDSESESDSNTDKIPRKTSNDSSAKSKPNVGAQPFAVSPIGVAKKEPGTIPIQQLKTVGVLNTQQTYVSIYYLMENLI